MKITIFISFLTTFSSYSMALINGKSYTEWTQICTRTLEKIQSEYYGNPIRKVGFCAGVICLKKYDHLVIFPQWCQSVDKYEKNCSKKYLPFPLCCHQSLCPHSAKTTKSKKSTTVPILPSDNSVMNNLTTVVVSAKTTAVITKATTPSPKKDDHVNILKPTPAESLNRLEIYDNAPHTVPLKKISPQKTKSANSNNIEKQCNENFLNCLKIFLKLIADDHQDQEQTRKNIQSIDIDAELPLSQSPYQNKRRIFLEEEEDEPQEFQAVQYNFK